MFPGTEHPTAPNGTELKLVGLLLRLRFIDSSSVASVIDGGSADDRYPQPSYLIDVNPRPASCAKSLQVKKNWSDPSRQLTISYQRRSAKFATVVINRRS